MKQLRTDAPITWCPGCGNFQILNAVEYILTELTEDGIPLEKIILVSGIGNHGKIVDYLHVNSFNSLHGRAIPAAEAIKIAEPDNHIICFVGDGDTYAEGLEHLVFAAKRNINITVVVHNNRTYGLATGQFTPTTQTSFTGSTMPYGAKEDPFNPLELMLVSGATFIARSYTLQREHFRKILLAAVRHKGFSLVDALQVCVTFNNLYDVYNEKVFEIEVKDPTDYDQALAAVRSWNYETLDAAVPVGIFYTAHRPTHEDRYPRSDMDAAVREQTRKEHLTKFLAQK